MNRYRTTFGINKKGSGVRVPVFSVLAVVNEEGQRCSDRKHSDEWNQFTELASSLFYFFLSRGPIDLPLPSLSLFLIVIASRWRTSVLNGPVIVACRTFFNILRTK